MGTQLLNFHEAMRALLGSHDMVCGFRRLFAVLCEHMPLEALAFDRYDAAGRALIIEDLVTHEGYFNVRLRVPLSPQGVDYVESNQGKQLVMHLAHELYLKLIPPEHALTLERHVSFRHRDYMAGGDIDLASLLPAPVAANLRHPTESSMMSRMAGETFDPPAPLGTPALPDSLEFAAKGPLEAGAPAMHGEMLDEVRIREALARCQGRVYGPQGAAALLGMNHNTLYSRLRKWGVRTRRVWES